MLAVERVLRLRDADIRREAARLRRLAQRDRHVEIGDGETKPIRIEITMNNSSGIYQVDELLKAKLRGSGLEPYVEVVAHIDTEAEKRLVPLYTLEI